MPEAKKILIVEDDQNISRLIKYNLEKEGFNCFIAPDGKSALEILEKETLDLVILDIMLPRINGLEVCRRIKQNEKFFSLPIIILSAKSEEVDKVVGFELGVDDYVTKPFSVRELVLRVKAVLKRRHLPSENKDVLMCGQLKVDISKHKVYSGKKEARLTAMEFKLLVTLMERKGRVQSRERLLNDVWDMASDVTTRTIDTHVKHLRQKLGNCGKFIETVRGIGYRFREEEQF